MGTGRILKILRQVKTNTYKWQNESDKYLHVCRMCFTITYLCNIQREKFHQNNFNIIKFFAQNTDCGYTDCRNARRGGSNDYPLSMFWIRNKENSYSFTI